MDTAKAKLTYEILAGLKPEHRGREWTEPASNMDSRGPDYALAALKPKNWVREWTEPSSNMDSWSDEE
eukprot:gene20008-26722_t